MYILFQKNNNGNLWFFIQPSSSSIYRISGVVRSKNGANSINIFIYILPSAKNSFAKNCEVKKKQIRFLFIIILTLSTGFQTFV